MKFIVDEMPLWSDDCPFFVGTCSDPVCQCGPEWKQHTCEYFKNGGCNPDDCPHLKPLNEDTSDGTIKDGLPF